MPGKVLLLFKDISGDEECLLYTCCQNSGLRSGSSTALGAREYVLKLG